ncbi:MAG: hypothetical protein ACXW4B_06070 [Micavibrio sp.]
MTKTSGKTFAAGKVGDEDVKDVAQRAFSDAARRLTAVIKLYWL